MKDLVRIKSLSKGLAIQLNQEAEFDDILNEVVKKFTEGKAFFGKACVAISFTGRVLSDSQQIQLIDAIQYNCDLTVICVVDHDEEQDKIFLRAMQQTERRRLSETAMEDEIQVFRGSLRGGEKLETPSSIIVLGDVEGGCSVTSEGNILIVGALYGSAHAGAGSVAKEGESNYVAALEMTPEALSIGDFKYNIPRKSIWGKKKTPQALVAKLQKDKIVVQELTNDILDSF